MIKRAFDLVSSSLALVLLAPVMAVIGIVVKRDSAGPALFKQERVGKDGELFTLLKFRSMTAAPVSASPLVTASTDARITKVGKALRDTKLDELPQLLNVVRGDMSIVGPRPEVPQYVALWSPLDRATILSVRPGITDPATVLARRESEGLAAQGDPEAYYRDVLLPQKAAAYCDYVSKRSFAGDLGIIFETLRAIVKG